MIAEIIPLLIGLGLLVLLICLLIGGALCMSGMLSDQERREMGLRLPGDAGNATDGTDGTENGASLWPCGGCGARDWEDAGNRCQANAACAADAVREAQYEHEQCHHRCPQCLRLHTQPGLFCSISCEMVFERERQARLPLAAENWLCRKCGQRWLVPGMHPDCDGEPADMVFAPRCASTSHVIFPKKEIPRVAVPAPTLRKGKVVR